MFEFWKSFRRHLRIGLQSPLRYWVFLFAFFHLVAENHGGTNPQSRLASMAAFSERGSLRLDPFYEEWTLDWAKTPDGVYSSNKAPGPTILALPAYLIFDAATQIGTNGLKESRLRKHKAGHAFLRIASFLFQIIPWALLSLIFLSLLKSLGYSFAAQQLFLLAFLFGNTLSVFLNAYFGHGVGGVFLALMTLAIYWKHLAWAGLFFGWALLSDYGAAAVLPGILILVISFKPSLKSFGNFVAGGIFPGIIWTWYHTHFYGSPFSLPNKFQNPVFVDLAHQETALWGIIDIIPSGQVAYELLLGSRRGLLPTQPWLLLCLVFALFWLFRSGSLRSKAPAVSLLLGFAGLFLMNASFGGWHGGGSSGPRYLSIVLPLFAFVVPWLYDSHNKAIKVTLGALVIYAVVINAAFLSTSIIHGLASVFDNLHHFFSHPHRWPTSVLRFGIFTLGALVVVKKISKLIKIDRP